MKRIARFASLLGPRVRRVGTRRSAVLVVGLVLVLGAAASAGIVLSGGGHASPSASFPPRLEGPAGAASGSHPSGRNASGPSPRPVVTAALHHDLSPPLRHITPVLGPRGIRAPKDVDHGLPVPRGSSQPDPVVQSALGSGQMPATSVSFDGLSAGQAGPTYVPPDPNSAVGPSNVFEISNAEIEVFTKTGGSVYGPAATRTLWSGFGGGCESNDDGDGTVVYDQLAGRWIVQQFVVNSLPYLECVAVSQTSSPTGAYYRYAFSFGNSDFPDYPKLAVWPDAYYATFNIFANGSTFSGPEVCAFDRTAMLAGNPASNVCFLLGSQFASLLPSTLDGSTPPPSGSPDFLLSFGTNSLRLWKFHVDWSNAANSTVTGPTTISVASFSPACGGGSCIPQPSPGEQLDSLADRLMYRLAYRNFGDHESLVVDQSVKNGTSGSGIRWYELRNPNGTPTVYQQGTFAPDSSYRWMGSIAMDQAGDIALGYSVSSSTVHPAIRYTGRLAGDQLGQMTQGEATLFAGSGSQSNSFHRWGDYTSMQVDPDGCTFWYTDEYIPANGSFNWHTRIGAFSFPGCVPNSNGSGSGSHPPTISCPSADGTWHGTNVTLTCTATDTSGDGFSPGATHTTTVDLSTTVPSGTETSSASTSSQQVCDTDGDCAYAGPISGNMIDRKAPSVAVSAPAGAGTESSPAFVSTSPTVGFSATDGGSGVASWTLTRYKESLVGSSCSGGWSVDHTATGSSGGSSLTDPETIQVGTCYKWTLTSTDVVGNGPSSVTSEVVTPTNAMIAASPTSLSYGLVIVGSNKSLTDTITNMGGTSVTLTAMSVNGTGFARNGGTCLTGQSLAGGASCTVSVRFAPRSRTTYSGTLSVTAGNTVTVPLSGQGK